MRFSELIVPSSVYGLQWPKLPCCLEIVVLWLVCHIQCRTCNGPITLFCHMLMSMFSTYSMLVQDALF